MLVYGKNVAKDFLKNKKNIKKIILQENFSDKEIISMIEKLKINYSIKKKIDMDRLCSVFIKV